MISYITLVHLSMCKYVEVNPEVFTLAVFIGRVPRPMIAMSIPVQHVLIFVALFPGMFAGKSTTLFVE